MRVKQSISKRLIEYTACVSSALATRVIVESSDALTAKVSARFFFIPGTSRTARLNTADDVLGHPTQGARRFSRKDGKVQRVDDAARSVAVPSSKSQMAAGDPLAQFRPVSLHPPALLYPAASCVTSSATLGHPRLQRPPLLQRLRFPLSPRLRPSIPGRKRGRREDCSSSFRIPPQFLPMYSSSFALLRFISAPTQHSHS